MQFGPLLPPLQPFLPSFLLKFLSFGEHFTFWLNEKPLVPGSWPMRSLSTFSLFPHLLFLAHVEFPPHSKTKTKHFWSSCICAHLFEPQALLQLRFPPYLPPPLLLWFVFSSGESDAAADGLGFLLSTFMFLTRKESTISSSGWTAQRLSSLLSPLPLRPFVFDSFIGTLSSSLGHQLSPLCCSLRRAHDALLSSQRRCSPTINAVLTHNSHHHFKWLGVSLPFSL